MRDWYMASCYDCGVDLGVEAEYATQRCRNCERSAMGLAPLPDDFDDVPTVVREVPRPSDLRATLEIAPLSMAELVEGDHEGVYRRSGRAA